MHARLSGLQVASLRLLFLVLCIVAFPLSAESSILRIFSDERNNVHVILPAGQESVIERERDQVGIDSIKIAAGKQTAGWIVMYRNPDGGSPIAGKIVVWRGGKIIRTFPAAQTFWSWSFERDGKQVAYHDGPAHGETGSHCELHDVQTGHLLSSWNGDLQNPARPDWTKSLDH